MVELIRKTSLWGAVDFRLYLNKKERNVCEYRIHTVNGDSCLFCKCPGPQTMSKSRNLQRKIRSCGMRSVYIDVSVSSTSYPAIASFIGVGFDQGEFSLDMGYRMILPTQHSYIPQVFSFNSKWINIYFSLW